MVRSRSMVLLAASAVVFGASAAPAQDEEAISSGDCNPCVETASSHYFTVGCAVELHDGNHGDSRRLGCDASHFVCPGGG